MAQPDNTTFFNNDKIFSQLKQMSAYNLDKQKSQLEGHQGALANLSSEKIASIGGGSNPSQITDLQTMLQNFSSLNA